MLGLSDPWIVTVFLLCMLSSLLCVLWGIFRWNSDASVIVEPEDAVKHWAEEEERVEDEF